MPKNKNPASIPIPPAVVMYCNFIQHKLSTIFIIYHIISTYCPQGNLVKLTKFLLYTLIYNRGAEGLQLTFPRNRGIVKSVF